MEGNGERHTLARKKRSSLQRMSSIPSVSWLQILLAYLLSPGCLLDSFYRASGVGPQGFLEASQPGGQAMEEVETKAFLELGPKGVPAAQRKPVRKATV